LPRAVLGFFAKNDKGVKSFSFHLQPIHAAFMSMAKQSKSKAKRKTSAWFHRHANDPHVKRAQAEGKRSRAAFKLTERLNKYKL